MQNTGCLLYTSYYIADHGIREAVFGGNMRDINLILENIVYLELLRRGYVVTVGRSGDKEIDFVCDKRGEKLYVQVTYLLASEETIIREFLSLIHIQMCIRDSYKPEEMVGKKVAVVTNLAPRKICGVESQGMILAAMDDKDNLSVMTVDKDIVAGSEIG